MPRNLHPSINLEQLKRTGEPLPGYGVIRLSLPFAGEIKDMGRMAVEHHRFDIKAIEGTISIVGEDFELTIVDGLHDAIRVRGFRIVRKQFDQLIKKILEDPFGETSIDAFKDTDAGQWARLVHRVEGPLADLVPGKKLAIKGTGLNMESTRKYLEMGGLRRAKLTDQFRKTLELSRAQQEKAPDGIGGLVFVNNIYGIVSYRKPDGQIQEWTLMEYVEDAKPMESHNIVMTSLGGPSTKLGFESDKYPELAAFIEAPFTPRDGRPVLFEDLAKKLTRELGYHINEFGDLGGHNILEQRIPAGLKYTVIDVQSH